ncbi:matrixin family metalloprotease [Leptospira licerasiae]|uniref:Matrixin domain protein n=2 Tax=Leptospira licerasiae TaxID=447106 RepID=A0ABP2RIA4_9LEPT|nr:matrixin family metalloprotease [Leptospira licerasiae]EIE02000.1 matrixin domain protein [Leptospira licerasiae serovar Varillal str. VAR 010]EJZ42926.1 matrixin domain protein [Leptospira licerasiae str. MMD4847]
MKNMKIKLFAIIALLIILTGSLSSYTIIFFRWQWNVIQPLVGFRYNLEMFYTDTVNSPPRVISEVLWPSYSSWNNEGNSNVTVADFGSTSNRTVARDFNNSIIATLDLDILARLFYMPNAIAAAVPWGVTQTLEINDCDVMIFPRPFFINPVDYTKLSLPTAFKHELGHCLGLLHSSERPYESNPVLKGALMYYSLGYGEVKSLNSDDIAGIKALYGERIDLNEILGNFCRALNIDPADPWCIVVACFAIGYCHL